MLVKSFGYASACVFILPTRDILTAQGNGADLLHQIARPPVGKELFVPVRPVVPVFDDQVAQAMDMIRTVRR